MITPAVERLRDELGLPGMAVLQFAFDGNPRNPHLPRNHRERQLVYTGTHDNDTAVGLVPRAAAARSRPGRAELVADPDGLRVAREPRDRPGAGRPRPRQRGADEHPGPGRGQLALAPRARSAHGGSTPSACGARAASASRSTVTQGGVTVVADEYRAPGMSTPWWRKAVVYEIYVRSFADSDGDGVGDLPGIRSRLGYLRDLGVDAIWLTPFYPSPGADHGYDVADYTDVDPQFGTLADFDALRADAHELGLRVLVDVVPNHTSNQHEWFRNALSDPSHPDRERYMFRPGRDGGPPNGWTSAFGGAAWELDKRSGEYYLHTFALEQPDLDWHNETVQRDFEDVLRFWLDRGVDGFRIDVAQALFKDQSLAEMEEPDPPDLARRLGHSRQPARAAPALPALAPARGRLPGRADVRR